MAILGLDIGGANIKAADLTGRAFSRSFEIWRHRDRLTDEIASILQEFPQTSQIALTMTAELADCFSTKTDGVGFIIDAVESAIGQFTSHVAFGHDDESQRVQVWTTEGRFVSSRTAKDQVLRVAASNWHALSTWVGSFVAAGTGLLIDIGTTTTDIIPLQDGQPVPAGLTDVDRLQSGELSYSAVWRTPLCAVAHSVPFRDGYCPLAAELFATTLDVHLLLDQIPEDAHNSDTANGKPATKQAAHDRIARMLCCDRDEISYDEAIQIARFLADVQRQRLAASLERVVQRRSSSCQFAVISGSGLFLARQLLQGNRRTANCQILSLADLKSQSVADAACAYSVAHLAARPNQC